MNYSNETILIGNGPSVLKREMGETIDSFGTIVRFNNFEIKDYEKYVGTRTDIWATRICQSIKPRTEEEFDSFDEIIGIVNKCLFTKTIERLVPQFLTKVPHATVIHAEQCAKYSQMFNYDFNKNWLSVGMIIILYMLDMEYADKLYLYGFGGSNKKHYFKLNPKDPKFHDFTKEAKHIHSLMKQDKIEIL